jgi:hypothetical protein
MGERKSLSAAIVLPESGSRLGCQSTLAAGQRARAISVHINLAQFPESPRREGKAPYPPGAVALTA